MSESSFIPNFAYSGKSGKVPRPLLHVKVWECGKTVKERSDTPSSPYILVMALSTQSSNLRRSIGLVCHHKQWIGLAQDLITDRDACKVIIIKFRQLAGCLQDGHIPYRPGTASREPSVFCSRLLEFAFRGQVPFCPATPAPFIDTT